MEDDAPSGGPFGASALGDHVRRHGVPTLVLFSAETGDEGEKAAAPEPYGGARVSARELVRGRAVFATCRVWDLESLGFRVVRVVRV